MKTVYEHFLRFADSLLAEKGDECKKNVASGMKAFLAEMDICNEVDPEGKISNRELLRFKMMPVDTFVAFFEYYEVRSRIVQFRRGCELLAVNRLKTGSLISNDAKARKLTEFYELVTELTLDKRYSSWIDDMATLVKTDLSFATGQSNVISRDIAEWLEMNS